MRSALTRRGKTMLSAAVVIAVIALLAGQRDLMHIAVLCLVLPLLSAVLVTRSTGGLLVARSVSAHRVNQGATITVTLKFKNSGNLPTGTILIEERGPNENVKRFALDRIAPLGRRQFTYEFAPRYRGLHKIGPLVATIVDPFGLASVTRHFNSSESVIALPNLYRLNARQFSGRRTGGSDSHTQAINVSGEDDVVPRPYRTGDELRRIHWKASARTGELMVRHEEQPWRTSATVIVDCRESPEFEWIVSCAASITTHLIQQGFAVHVLDTGNALLGTADDGHASENLLTMFALLNAQKMHRVAVGTTTDHDAGDTLVIAVVSPMGSEDASTLAAARRGRSGTAIIAAQSGASATDSAQATASLLQSQGWTVGIAVQGETPDQTWDRARATAVITP